MYIHSILLPLSIFITIIGTNIPEGALIIICIGARLVNVSLFGLLNVSTIYALEIMPTEIRGTGAGLKMLFDSIGATLGLVLSSILALYFGLTASFIVFSLTLFVNIPLIYKYLKETKGIELK